MADPQTPTQQEYDQDQGTQGVTLDMSKSTPLAPSQTAPPDSTTGVTLDMSKSKPLVAASAAPPQTAPAPSSQGDAHGGAGYAAIYKSLTDFAKARNVTMTGSENLQELYDKVKNFSGAPVPPGLGPYEGEYRIGREAIDFGKGALAAQQHEVDTGVAQYAQPGFMNKAGGIIRYVQGGIPLLGPLLGAIEDHLSNREYAQAAGVASSLATPEVVDKVGTKIVNTFKTAVDDTAALTRTHDARLKELDVARQQAADAQLAADKAKLAEGSARTPQEIETAAQNTSQAQTVASQQQANLSRAEAAVKAAAEAKAQAALKVAQSGRQIANQAAKKAKAGPSPEEIAKSNADFQKAIPAGPGKSAYTPEDLKAVNPILERHHANTAPVDSPQAVVDALESDRVSRDNKVKAAVQKYSDEPLKLADADENAVSVKQKLVEALADDEKVRPGFTEAALKELDKFNTTDPSVGEADELRKTLNTENRDKLNASGGARSIADARETDPEFAARYELADILRDGVYGKLEEKGVKGARESRQLDASAIRVRNAAERQVKRADVQARGTGEAGPVAKIASKVAKTVGIGGGAALGAATGIPFATEAGAIIGGSAGQAAADFLAPGDLTRSELIQRRMKTMHGGDVPTLDTSGAQPSVLPAEPLPPTVEAPINPRENTGLHAALATHFDEPIGETPYNELEQRLLQDIADKKKYNVPVDPAERKLNLEINKAKVQELQRARGLAEEQVKAREKAKADVEAERAEKEKLGLKTNLATPFESESHISPEDEFTLHHELGHHFQIAKAGYPTQDIIGRLHADIDSGAQAQARWDVSDFLDDKGKIDLGKVKDNIEALLDIFHGGAVADEVMRDVPVHRNSGARTDLRRMRTLLIDAGFAPTEAGQLMGASEGRVRQDFTKSGIRDIFQRYSQAREAGLNLGLLMSEETSGRAIQDFKNALEAKENTGEGENKSATPGKNQRGDRESNPGRTGGVQARGKEANKSARSTGESSGSGAGREEPRLKAAKAEPEERLPKVENLRVPQERTTGEHDAAIKEGGGIPGGVQEGDEEIGLKDLVLFHDPTTGSTLALPVDKVSAENVKAQLRKSRDMYIAAEDKKAKVAHPDDHAKNHEGEQ